MALSIKTEEADRLARELSRLTGESMTEAVTASLRERLERAKKARPKKRTKKEIQEELRDLRAFTARIRKKYDFSKVRSDKAYYDALWGEDEITAMKK